MPAFPKQERARLRWRALAPRGKPTKIEDLPEQSADWALIFALRLAALFNLSRRDLALPVPACKASKSGFQLTLQRAWLEEHPMTEGALESETEEWRALGVKLELRSSATEDRPALPRGSE